MRKSLIPALLIGMTIAAIPCAAHDGWLGQLERHARADVLHRETAPFHFEVEESRSVGFVISGERIHLENGILTAHFDSIRGDDGTKLDQVDAKSKLSLGGDFLNDPIRKAVEAFLQYTDMTVQKAELPFSLAELAGTDLEASAEILAMPARDIRMTMRGKAMEMWLKSIVSVHATGKASYRPAEKKIDIEVSGADASGIPIPSALLFHVLEKALKYPFVEVHKPYVTLDLGWFLFPAPQGS